MADWRNRMFQIEHKIKHQLNAKGVDNVEQLAQTLAVSSLFLFASAFL